MIQAARCTTLTELHAIKNIAFYLDTFNLDTLVLREDSGLKGFHIFSKNAMPFEHVPTLEAVVFRFFLPKLWSMVLHVILGQRVSQSTYPASLSIFLFLSERKLSRMAEGTCQHITFMQAEIDT